MNIGVIVRPEAAADASEAARWYERKLPGLGTRFLETLDRTIMALSDNPKQYPVYHRAIRRGHLQGFPYAVFFVLGANAIVILAIFHLHRDPRLIRRTLRRRG